MIDYNIIIFNNVPNKVIISYNVAYNIISSYNGRLEHYRI